MCASLVRMSGKQQSTAQGLMLKVLVCDSSCMCSRDGPGACKHSCTRLCQHLLLLPAEQLLVLLREHGMERLAGLAGDLGRSSLPMLVLQRLLADDAGVSSKAD